jgi:hypothetical protein
MDAKKTVLQVLREARELLSDEKRWTRGSFAKNALGIDVEPTSDSAACFCAHGALLRAAGGDDTCSGLVFAELALRDAARVIFGNSSIVEVNDHRPDGHAGVLSLFDSAIKAETRAEQARSVSR